MRVRLANVPYTVGGTVGAYTGNNEAQQRAGAAPVSPQWTSAVVAADRSLTFTGLDPDTDYFAAAQIAGHWHYIGFTSPPSQTARYSNDDPEDVTFRSDAPAGQLADVFQQFIGDVKTVWIDKDGVLHLTGASADGVELQKRVLVVDAGNLDAFQEIETEFEAEVWLLGTLVANTTLAPVDLASGTIVRAFVTQDGNGPWTLEVFDGVVSVPVEVDERASATTLVTIYGAAGELIVGGGTTDRPARELTDDYVIRPTDAGRPLVFDTATRKTLTVPFDSGEIEAGAEIPFFEVGAGDVEVRAEAGVAILRADTNRVLTRGVRGLLVNIGTNMWVLQGDLDPTTTFDLTTLTSLVGLYDFSAVAGLSDLAAIPTVQDGSAANNDATASSAGRRPAFKLRGRNGRPVGGFDGVDDCLAVAGIVNDHAARTVFFVGAQIGSPTFDRWAWDLYDTGAGLQEVAGVWKYDRNQADAKVTIGGAASTLSVVTLRFNSTGSAEAFLNDGAAVAFDPKDLYQASGQGLVIGAQTTQNFPWQGDVCHVIVCDAALADPELSNAIAALMAYWGIG